jgi:hypothetical protein
MQAQTESDFLQPLSLGCLHGVSQFRTPLGNRIRMRETKFLRSLVHRAGRDDGSHCSNAGKQHQSTRAQGKPFRSLSFRGPQRQAMTLCSGKKCVTTIPFVVLARRERMIDCFSRIRLSERQNFGVVSPRSMSLITTTSFASCSWASIP